MQAGEEVRDELTNAEASIEIDELRDTVGAGGAPKKPKRKTGT